jgi:hypothetical protein
MLTLHHADGRQWPVPDEFALLTTMEPAEFVALVDLARAQARLDASARPVADGVIVHPLNCRHRRDAIARDESPLLCRWTDDPAGGFACLQCGTWAKPDSERARVIRLAVVPSRLVHVSDLRVGDTFRFAGENTEPYTVGNVHQMDDGVCVDVGGFAFYCRDGEDTGERVMVEIIARGLAVVP